MTSLRIASVVASMAALAIACAPASRDAGSGVTLRFWAFGREGEVVQSLMPEFERRNPGVHVRVQQIPWTAAHEKLLTAYVGRATPDVAQLGNTWVPELVTLNALTPLDSNLARSREVAQRDFFPGIWDTNVIDGGAYGIPWYVDTRVLFYRTDLLAAAGYDAMPTTWSAWRDAMVKIRQRGGVGHYAIYLPTNEWTQPVIFGLQSGAQLLAPDGSTGRFEEPRFRESFRWYIQLFRDSLAPVVGLQQMANLYQDFARGGFAMYISGPWQIGEFSRRMPPEMQDKWMTAPLPGPTGPGVSLAGGSSLVIFRASSHAAESWKLIEFLSAPEQQVKFYQLTGDLPATEPAWRDTVLANNKYARAFHEQLLRVIATPKVPEWEQIATKVFDIAELSIRGNVAPEKALEQLDGDVNQMLEKRRWMLAHTTAAAR